MKKLILLALTPFMAMSCSDDDVNNVPIDGTWKLTYIKLEGDGFDQNKDGKISKNYIDEVPCMGNSVLTFNGNNAVFTMGDNGNGQSRTANDNTPSTCPMKTPEKTTYAVNNNSVEFTYTSLENQPGTILKRTFKRSGKKLIATLDYEGGSYIPGSGEYGDSNFYSHATFEFTKQ